MRSPNERIPPSPTPLRSSAGSPCRRLRTGPLRRKYEKKVNTLPKHLDEKVVRLHLAKIGAKLTKMSDKQATYIGVPADGPYKPDTYRYRAPQGRARNINTAFSDTPSPPTR